LADNPMHYYLNGDKNQAEIEFLNALQIYPNDTYLLEMYASKLVFEGRQIEALNQFQRLTELAPTSENFAALAKAKLAGTQ
jgi:Flp pilus assembly protein TadD